MNTEKENLLNNILFDGLYQSKNVLQIINRVSEAFHIHIEYLTFSDYLSSFSGKLSQPVTGSSELFYPVQDALLRLIHNSDNSIHEIVEKGGIHVFFQLISVGKIPSSIIIAECPAGTDPTDIRSIISSLSRTALYFEKNSPELTLSEDSARATLSTFLLSDVPMPEQFYNVLSHIYSGYGYSTPPGYIMAYFEDSQFNSSTNINKFFSDISTVCRETYRRGEKNYVTVLFCGIDLKHINALTEFEESILLICRENHIRGAFSMPFSELNLCPLYRRQAVTSFRIGNHKKPELILYKASQYLAEILTAEAISVTPKKALILSDITILVNYDRTNGTSLLETLEQYLENRCKSSAAAAALFIDRSTLKYRLNKISEMLHADLDNNETILTLRNAIRVYRVSGMMQ